MAGVALGVNVGTGETRGPTRVEPCITGVAGGRVGRACCTLGVKVVAGTAGTPVWVKADVANSANCCVVLTLGALGVDVRAWIA